MKNRVFVHKTSEEKQRHLTEVLRAAAGGALNDSMIKWIISIVYIHKQYAVTTYTDNKLFYDAVESARADNILMSVVSVQSGNGTAAAVIMPIRNCATGKDKRAILVYSPGNLCRKGATYAEKS